ncbi:MAG: hypothetical protein Q9218_002680 [Villophora microphyllina]
MQSFRADRESGNSSYGHLANENGEGDSASMYLIDQTSRLPHDRPCDDGSPDEEVQDEQSSAHTALTSFDGGSTPLPTTDQYGAIQSLDPKQLVSATAIELTLRTILAFDDHDAFRVLDPSYLDLSDPVPAISKPPSLADINPSNQVISYYDSNSSTRVEGLAKKMLLAFVKHLSTGRDDSMWAFQVMGSAQQENFYDCGIFVLVNTLSLVLSDFQPPNPKMFVDCALWRVVFQSLIGGKALDKILLAPAESLASTTKKIQTIEDELSQISHLISDLGTKCKTIPRPAALQPLRSGEAEAREESGRLKGKVEAYRSGAKGLQAAKATAHNTRDARERQCRHLEEDNKGITQMMRDFRQEQRIMAAEQEKMLTQALLDEL